MDPAPDPGTEHAAVPWLDADEQQAWRAYLEATTRVTDRLNDDLKRAFGLTLEDYEVLVFLSEAPDRRMRMADLAGALLASRSRLTYRIDRLETAGLVARRPCPSDGRAIWAELTELGYQRLVEAAPLHVRGVRAALSDHFTRDEWLRFGSILRTVADAEANAAGKPEAVETPPESSGSR
ncbi:MAG: MarR family winged helix-turn-helix transcriptional regulator [Acidimicrobiales bacterium]